MDRQSSEVFLLSNQANSMVIWDANKLNPFYGKLISSEVDAKMNEWVKMMQGESMEDYAIRVNDETRLKQQQLFEQEVATRMQVTVSLWKIRLSETMMQPAES